MGKHKAGERACCRIQTRRVHDGVGIMEEEKICLDAVFMQD